MLWQRVLARSLAASIANCLAVLLSRALCVDAVAMTNLPFDQSSIAGRLRAAHLDLISNILTAEAIAI